MVDRSACWCYAGIMTTSRDAIVAHNMHYIQLMRDRAAVANTAGGTCPQCGGGANPTILAAWGHCVECHKAAGFGK